MEDIISGVAKIDIDSKSSSPDYGKNKFTPDKEYTEFQERKTYHNRQKPLLGILKSAFGQYKRMLSTVNNWSEYQELRKFIKKFVKLYLTERPKSDFRYKTDTLKTLWQLMINIDNQLETIIVMGSFSDLKMS